MEDVTVTPPSSDDDELDVQDEEQPAWQRVSQSVEQSKVGGLLAHCVEQLVPQVCVQVASACAVHWESHCFSSFAAHASSHVGGAQTVLQSLWKAIEHCALASMSMSPQAPTTSARAVLGATTAAATAAKGTTARDQRWQVVVLMEGLDCNA